MLMNPISEAGSTRPAASEQERSGGRSFAVLLIASLAIAGWSLASVSLIRGFDFWVSSQANLIHVAINVACSALAAAYASRLRGTLEFKFGQAIAATVAIFGLYALGILVGRLFFSRSMFGFALIGAVCVSVLVVGLRHRLMRARVAIISPLIGGSTFSVPFARIVSDPSKDLRQFDIVLVSLTEHVSADWGRALSRAMLAGCKVRHIGQYVEELSGAVSL
ncbi:hypothetical protein, partial [Phenylobacterium sp.]|uniref:hypothetical protein n=1 Tax=Phenylobacterium sp. TaxID=1871053 RepID=UPI00286D9848